MQYGKEHGVDTDRLNAVLFDACYEEGLNLSLVDDLVQVASRHFDWEPQDLRQYLDQDAGARIVKSEMQTERRKYGVSSVPYFVIGNGEGTPYGVSGAQSSATLKSIFVELSEE